ncbi:probable RNA-binding protein 18 isoform X2 [Hemitrygon akajei]|uniref:probable RNA-binding protein 18 isoform X2 n=1 Tax=Hemitrygon akajei TaxID=2704970 RepID=UPI003BF9BE8D
METENESLPLENASILSESSSQEGHRLWIGNLDSRLTEYNLLKLLQKFGKVKQFDFLFHKSGPLEGQPRGYCFVNFETKEEAERAIQCLNGKLALAKKLVVRWAHAQIKMVWPPQSPDLSITEAVWDYLERQSKQDSQSPKKNCGKFSKMLGTTHQPVFL